MMKLFTVAAMVLSLNSMAAVVNSVRLDDSGKNVIVSVTYGGGCREHNFNLKVNGLCLESYPMQCSAEVIETTVGGFDMCEAIITRDVTFNIKKNKLSSMTYWTFLGDVNQSGERSSATLLLR